VIGGEDESPACIRFRFPDRSDALLVKKHGDIGDRLSGGVSNRAFDSDRKMRGTILLESCRAPLNRRMWQPVWREPRFFDSVSFEKGARVCASRLSSRPNSFR